MERVHLDALIKAELFYSVNQHNLEVVMLSKNHFLLTVVSKIPSSFLEVVASLQAESFWSSRGVSPALKCLEVFFDTGKQLACESILGAW